MEVIILTPVIDYLDTSKYGYPKDVQIQAVIKAFTDYVFSNK